MAKRKKKPEYDIATMQPSELNELKKVAQEFITRMQNVDNEIKGLQEDRKTVIEEFSEKLDVKTLALALKVLKIESTVENRGSYDMFIESLRDPGDLLNT